MAKEVGGLSDKIEQDFLDAIDRLLQGRPRHSKHKEWLATRGKVPLNISTVAREAGRARGLIASKKTKYREIRDRIEAAAVKNSSEPNSRHDVISDLRGQVLELRLEVKKLREHAAYHFKMRSEAEELLGELRERHSRLLRKLGKSSSDGRTVKLLNSDDQL